MTTDGIIVHCKCKLLNLSYFDKYDADDIPLVSAITHAPKAVKQSLGIIEGGTDDTQWHILMKLSEMASQIDIMSMIEAISILYHIKRMRITSIESIPINRKEVLWRDEKQQRTKDI